MSAVATKDGMMMRESIDTLVVASGIACWLAGQSLAAAPQPEFEVASVKPNRSGDPRSSIGFQLGGRFVATNIQVNDLVAFAFNQQTYQVMAVPSAIPTPD